MLPVHVQRDEDAALGAAWRRCEVALPSGWMLELGNWVGELTRPKELAPYEAIAEPLDGQALTLYGHTPTEALAALAEALERRNVDGA